MGRLEEFKILNEINYPRTKQLINNVLKSPEEYIDHISIDKEDEKIKKQIISEIGYELNKEPRTINDFLAGKNNAKDTLDAFVDMFGRDAKEMVIYNYELEEYQCLLKELDEYIENTNDIQNKEPLLYAIYKQIKMERERISISQILGYFPLLEKEDFIKIVSQYKFDNLLKLDATNIVNTLMECVEQSRYIDAKTFYFQYIKYIKEEKLRLSCRELNEEAVKLEYRNFSEVLEKYRKGYNEYKGLVVKLSKFNKNDYSDNTYEVGKRVCIEYIQKNISPLFKNHFI